ncbi:MAG: ATP-binding cassette domain-containing protein [Rhizobiaceae bacterium]|nr:ATP-binding cassette domain-containing protein [Rhizobiaceae bacterium]
MPLIAKNLIAGYGGKPVLEKVSFTLEDGEILAFFGHNGAGKSTTLKAVLGLIDTIEGEVILNGENIEKMSVDQRLERGMKLLPEGRGVFPDLSVRENIEVVDAVNRKNGRQMISAPDVYELLPVLAERRSSIAGELSGGQQQMLALGIALLGSPKCLLLEEPSVGLQPDLVENLFSKISEVCKHLRVPAILIEHKIVSALKIADKVMIINSGRLVFNGSKQEAEKIDLWNYF